MSIILFQILIGICRDDSGPLCFRVSRVRIWICSALICICTVKLLLIHFCRVARTSSPIGVRFWFFGHYKYANQFLLCCQQNYSLSRCMVTQLLILCPISNCSFCNTFFKCFNKLTWNNGFLIHFFVIYCYIKVFQLFL